jgi:hypothetical protein
MNLGSVDEYFFIVGSLRCAWYVSCLVLWLISFDIFWKSILLRPIVFGPSLFPSYRLFSLRVQRLLSEFHQEFADFIQLTSAPRTGSVINSHCRPVIRMYYCTREGNQVSAWNELTGSSDVSIRCSLKLNRWHITARNQCWLALGKPLMAIKSVHEMNWLDHPMVAFAARLRAGMS